jgi:3-hydroxyisobutyrate dehydrogenase-like beta-hydroxyacid dehydrogenase
MKIGLIGAGRMGTALGGRLLDGGHSLKVHDLDPASVAPLVGRGAMHAAALEDTFDAELVITLVPDDKAVAAIWLAGERIGRLPERTVHACMASISYAMGGRLAAAHAEAGRRYLSVPLFGRPPLAARGELDVIVAGDPAAIADCRPALETIGRQVFEVGARPEQANLVKIARNFLVANAIEGLGEAFALCGRGGIDAERFLQVLVNTSLGAPAYRYYGGYLVARSRETLLPMHLGLKDIELSMQAAMELDTELPTAALIRGQMLAAIADGWGDRDWAALGEWIDQRAAARALAGARDE